MELLIVIGVAVAALVAVIIKEWWGTKGWREVRCSLCQAETLGGFLYCSICKDAGRVSRALMVRQTQAGVFVVICSRCGRVISRLRTNELDNEKRDRVTSSPRRHGPSQN